jgi:tetratricopeptide (TPR) repeat protein
MDENLAKLAELYECTVSDLLSDCPDFRHLDSAHKPSAVLAESPTSEQARPTEDVSWLIQPQRVHTLLDWIRRSDNSEVANLMATSLYKSGLGLTRRDLLKLAGLFGFTAAHPIWDFSDEDERMHALNVLGGQGPLDEPTVIHAEKAIQAFRQQGDHFGPAITLHATLSQRENIGDKLEADLVPQHLVKRALSVYAELTQLVGWLQFDSGNYSAAQHYYDRARELAHDAENDELASYVLCTMAQLAIWKGQARVAIDHAMAAQSWASQAGTSARAYAADIAVRAHLTANQPNRCWRLLDMEHKVLDEGEQDRPAGWWYFFDESFYWGTRTRCLIRFGAPDKALEAATKSLATVPHDNIHERAFRSLFRAEAILRHGDIDEATKAIAAVASLAAENSSRRIEQHIGELRRTLAPWEREKSVQELDECLMAYRPSLAASGKTYKS